MTTPDDSYDAVYPGSEQEALAHELEAERILEEGDDDASDELGDGIHDIPEHEYHRRPELSSTGARRLLESPAKFHWRQQQSGEEEHKGVFDFGHALHGLVLGVGREVVVLEYDDFRKKAAQEERDEAYATGRTPLLRKDWDRAQAMAGKVHDHPVAAVLLDPERGSVEQSAFWTDPATGVRCRCRFDKLPDLDADGRLIVVDYKTAAAADVAAFGKASADYGYCMQAPWYLDAIHTLLDRLDAAFVFVVQEKEPPYLVNVIELDAYALTIGRERNRRAMQLFVECTESGVWPGYGPDVERASLPRWFELQHEAEYGEQPLNP